MAASCSSAGPIPHVRRWSPLTITSNAPASRAYTTGSPAGPSSMSGWVWLRPSAVAAIRSNEVTGSPWVPTGRNAG